MTDDGATRPWGLRGLALATFLVASLALNVVLLWKLSITDEHVRRVPDVAAPETEPLARLAPSPAPVKRPSANGDGERPSRPNGDHRATPEVDSGRRELEPDPSPPATAGLHANAKRPEPGAPSAARAVPATGSSNAVPRAADSGAAGPAVAASSPERSKAPPPAEDEHGSSDRNPPVLELLRFYPPVVEDGTVTTLTIQASDDLSGVKSVRGEIQSPSGSAVLPIPPQDVGANNTFTVPITVPRKAESGVWYVKWISLTDVAHNASLDQAITAATALPGGAFTVHSSESDSTPPEVLQVGFEKATVGDEERNVIRVEARDDSSGVASISGACRSPSKAALIPFNCVLNAESGIWEGDFVVPKNAECGGWGIQNLSATDKAGNTTLLKSDSPLLAAAGFQVASRAGCDSTPPILSALNLAPAVVSNEEATEILVTATVYDEGSGAATMTGWFEGPVSEGGQVPKAYFNCSPNPEDPAAPWTGKILVPQFAAKGTWKVRVIRLEDKAGNFREYTSASPVVSGGVYNVQ